ncbi:hypothetical protein TNCV_206271 [Trichonephila clavipes]|nr:hypothetical protein TNCV_206271 [Trichonephila clavipes]
MERYTTFWKNPDGSELTNLFINDAKMVSKVAKLDTNLFAKMMPSWPYRRDLSFSLNRHYNNLRGRTGAILCSSSVPLASKNQEINRLQLAVVALGNLV